VVSHIIVSPGNGPRDDPHLRTLWDAQMPIASGESGQMEWRRAEKARRRKLAKGCAGAGSCALCAVRNAKSKATADQAL
jgi:hypothetical protein